MTAPSATLWATRPDECGDATGTPPYRPRSSAKVERHDPLAKERANLLVWESRRELRRETKGEASCIVYRILCGKVLVLPEGKEAVGRLEFQQPPEGETLLLNPFRCPKSGETHTPSTGRFPCV